MPLLEIRAVRFAWPAGGEAIRGVSLAVERGEVVAVVGPNGAGKSTLLRLASGLLAPSSGSVRLEGREVSGLPRAEAGRRIAGVPAEEPSRFPFTVEETVALGRHPWRGAFGGLARADVLAVEEALAVGDLGELRHRPLPRLSSGERQRAAMARALAQGGDLVLLDEPTSHLDLGHRVRMLGVFRARARERGQAVLAALHDLNLAALFADRVVLLAAGCAVVSGTPGEVLTASAVRDAFGAPVHVLSHPETGGPVVVPAVGGGAP